MVDILLSTMRLSIPLIFAAYGGMLSERSGIANIALESFLISSAFTAAAITHFSGSLVVGTLAALVMTAIIGTLFAVICIWGRGDQIVIGTAMNLLAAGLTPILSKSFFNVTGSTPSLPIDLRFSEPWMFFALTLAMLALLELLFRKSRHGLRILAAGHNPHALSSQGLSYRLVRLRAVIEGAMIAALGGIYLSLCMSSGYIRGMSAGRGFLALAALIFGGWRPLPTLLACIFFGFTDAVQIRLQGMTIDGVQIPSQFVQILPFVATLIVLSLHRGKVRPPRAINQQ